MKYFNNFDPVGKLTQRVIFFNFIFLVVLNLWLIFNVEN